MIGRVLLFAMLLALVVAIPAVAQDGGACAERFPEVDWTRIQAPVGVYVGSVPPGHAARYAEETTGGVTQINSYYGEFDATVCFFDRASGLDTSPYVSGSNRLHAMLFVDESLLLVATDNVGLTGSAAAFGLAQIAMWQFTDGAGFPEPQASTISEFFQSEVRNREVMDHAEAKAAGFYTPAAAPGFISKRRGKRRPETPQLIPGFFDDSSSSAG